MPPHPAGFGPADGGAPPRPTLLVFTLGAVAEGRRRHLLPERFRDRETALYRACLDEALAAGRACGFRLAVSAPSRAALGDASRDPRDPRDPTIVLHEQAGSGFGERLAAAFDAAGPTPGAPVVVVGTDTPGLCAARLRDAAGTVLAAGCPDRVVLGPSPDGGIYLLAASRPLGDVLRRVPWRRRHTLRSLRRALERSGLTVRLLAPLADLDRPADLDGWLARRRGAACPTVVTALARVATALSRLLAALRAPGFAPAPARLLPAVVPVRSGRAPPRA